MLGKLKKAKEEPDKRSDVERAKEKAAKIREQGIIRYKQHLLVELESDKRKKLCVVNFLFFLSMITLAAFYYARNWVDFELMMANVQKRLNNAYNSL